MSKRTKDRQSPQKILASCSDAIFPAGLGNARVDLDSAGVDNHTPLHVLLRRADDRGVRRLSEAGANVDAIGELSGPPLHIAARYSFSTFC